MGEYFIGSDGELYHWGVKGMKWGVRRYQNKDGSLTEAGRKRLAGKIEKKIEWETSRRWVQGKGFSGETITSPKIWQTKIENMSEVRKLHKDLADARKERNEAYEFAREFNNDKELVMRYAEKAARKACKDAGITDPKVIESAIWQYKYDDGDQGEGNSFEIYCRDKGVDPRAYKRKVCDAENKYNDTCENCVQSLLQEAGNRVIYTSKWNPNYKKTISDIVRSSLENLDDETRFREGNYISY